MHGKFGDPDAFSTHIKLQKHLLTTASFFFFISGSRSLYLYSKWYIVLSLST